MADRYWVGGTANWDATAGTKWATTDGGAGGAAVPTSSDNVFFTAASGAVTVTVAASVACLNINFTGFTGTFTGTSARIIDVYGDLTLATGMTNTLAGGWRFMATSGAKTITSNGKSIGAYTDFSGVGASFTLADDLTFAGANSSFIIRASVNFVANSKKILFTGSGSASISSSNTSVYLYDVERKPATATTGIIFYINSQVFITNSLVIDSNSTDHRYRVLVCSNVRGTARTITCNGTLTANYCDFEDITGAGSASWNLSAATGGSGNCGGNSGITFTTGISKYMIGISGTTDFHTTTKWSTTSGGSNDTTPPLPQDTAYINGSSGSGTARTLMPRLGTVDFTGFTGTATCGAAVSIYGSLIFDSGLTSSWNNPTTFCGRGSYVYDTKGKAIGSFGLTAFGGTLTLLSDLNTTLNATSGTSVFDGVFDANGFNVTTASFTANVSGSPSRSVYMRSGTWTLTRGDADMWDTRSSTGFTFDSGTSTIKVTGTLTGDRLLRFGGRTFYNFENATSGAFSTIIEGSNTFNQFKVNAGRTQKFTAGTTTTAATWVLTGTSGSGITLTSGTAATHTLAKSGGGTVTADYATISYSIASPSSTFYATNSTDGGNNTNWTFSAPPSGFTANNIFFGSNF